MFASSGLVSFYLMNSLVKSLWPPMFPLDCFMTSMSGVQSRAIIRAACESLDLLLLLFRAGLGFEEWEVQSSWTGCGGVSHCCSCTAPHTDTEAGWLLHESASGEDRTTHLDNSPSISWWHKPVHKCESNPGKWAISLLHFYSNCIIIL